SGNHCLWGSCYVAMGEIRARRTGYTQFFIPGKAMTPHADIIFTNVRAFTGNDAAPRAEAVAVKGNRITFVGDASGAESWRGPATRVIPGRGKTLLSGFIDAHFHLLWGSTRFDGAQLGEVKTTGGLKKVLLDFAGENKGTPWVNGNGLRYGIVSTRRELDGIIAERPVYVEAFDTHTAWVNTKALEMAGILHPGQGIGANGGIVRDAAGLATGELRDDSAMSVVRDLVPAPSERRKRELLAPRMRQITAAGITSIHNMNGDREEIMTYSAMEDAGEMLLRVYVPYWVKPEATEGMLTEAAEMARIQKDYVRGGAAKFFIDGIWESYTALAIGPYADDPAAAADGIWSLDRFIEMAGACDRMGLQIFAHACGDGAVRRALDGYEAIRRSNGKRDSRHRVEHIEVIHPDDMPRFRQLGVIASLQPLHAPMTPGDAPVWSAKTGPGRWPLSFAWRELKNAGARMVFGSDWMVAPFDPMLGIHRALTRRPWQPGFPDQRLTLEEILMAYTRDAAYAEFQEHRKGQLKEGYLADIVLLSEDIFQTEPEDIPNVKPLLTMVDGEVVYEV
ncbi:MAG: hypothetical protein BECKG1743E_GA0114224_100911, partial [Candidatus Kentron sp. G]